MDKEVAKLWLYANALTTTVTPVGFRNSAGTSYTWFVDMKQVLGETLWTKYDAYVMTFVRFARINTIPYVYIDGLNIIQTSKNGAPQGGAAIVSLVNQAYANQGIFVGYESYTGSADFIITKPVDNRINLNIYWEPQTGANGNLSYGSFVFTFQGLKTYNPLYKNPFDTYHNLEQRTFTLQTASLPYNSSNEIGSMNANYTVFSFKNLNMRNIIGRMWDKYDKFNLIMTNWGTGINQGGTLSGDQRYIFFSIEGLQFINNAYFGSNMFLGRYAPCGFGFTEGAGATNSRASFNLFENLSSCNTFRKPESENVTLEFQVGALTVFPSTNVFANWNLSFMVIGVKDE
jgi:hypothetical protein